MRIALISDIHANSIALDAVLADIEQRGVVEGYWLLGDYAPIGFDPAGVVERLRALPNTTIIRGNGDRYVLTGERPAPSFIQARDNPERIPLLVEVHSHFAWITGHLVGRGHFDWLKSLPTEQRLTLPDGTRVLLTHASMVSDTGSGLNPSLSADRCRELTAGADADLICVGHFHMPMDRPLDGVRIINPGSVSNHLTSDLRACYALLTADQHGHSFTFHRVPYDTQAALDATANSSVIGMEFIMRLLKGQDEGEWMRNWDKVTFAPPITP